MQDVTFEQLDGPTAFGAGVGGDPVARAAAETEHARRRTLEHAQAEGYAAGLAAARGNVASATAALGEMLAGLQPAHEEFLQIAERRAIELALALADKIIGEALELKPELVVATVAGTLRAAAERDHLIVEVSPADFELVREAAAELTGRVGGVHKLEVVAERRVPRGSCIVRTSEGEIDGRHIEKLAIAGELLRDALTGDASA